MRILVYEHLTANPPPPDATAALLDEGRAMLLAAATELASVDGVEVLAPVHAGHGGGSSSLFPSGSPYPFSGSLPAFSCSLPPCGGGLGWGVRTPTAISETPAPPEPNEHQRQTRLGGSLALPGRLALPGHLDCNPGGRSFRRAANVGGFPEAEGDCTPHPNPPPQGGREPEGRREQEKGGDAKSPLLLPTTLPGDRFLAETPADFVLLIAPEMDNVLARLARIVEASGKRLLGPNSEQVELLSDKRATAEALGDLCVQEVDPRSLPPDDLIVVKPRDGVGALFTAVGPAAMHTEIIAAIRERSCESELLLQPYLPGVAASVAVINGVALPAVQQDIVGAPDLNEPRLQWLSYRGGRFPLSATLDERARSLALAAARKLGTHDGYVGFDLVLGESADASGDRVIEVNPRLTTSFVGYRAAFPGVMGRLLAGVASEEVRRRLDSINRMEVWAFDGAGNVAASSAQVVQMRSGAASAAP